MKKTTMTEDDESPLRRLLRQYAHSKLAVLGAAVLGAAGVAS